jgi:hypothetical protein
MAGLAARAINARYPGTSDGPERMWRCEPNAFQTVPLANGAPPAQEPEVQPSGFPAITVRSRSTTSAWGAP